MTDVPNTNPAENAPGNDDEDKDKRVKINVSIYLSAI